MDIWHFGRETDFSADYYDMHTGYVYHLQEYGRLKKFGLPNPYGGIVVTDNGSIIGVVREENSSESADESDTDDEYI